MSSIPEIITISPASASSRVLVPSLETQQLVDAAFGNLFFMVHNGNDLAGFDAAIQDAADTEAAGVVVIVQLGNLQLQRFCPRCRLVQEYVLRWFKQRTHIVALVGFFNLAKPERPEA